MRGRDVLRSWDAGFPHSPLMGSTLFVILTGMEIGLLATADAGAEVQAVQSAQKGNS